MITRLYINNFILIEKQEIEFASGFNVLTGETGSGKSMIIEAIHLALGGRADKSYIRDPKQRCVIQLVLEPQIENIKFFLDKNAIEFDGQLIITRELLENGKNICKINDRMVTIGFLKKLTKQLIDVHGQYEHQSLLNPDQHIHILDNFNTDIGNLKLELSLAYSKYKEDQRKLLDLNTKQAELLRQKDFLTYELSEIESADIIIGEDLKLEQTLKICQNKEKIHTHISEAHQFLFGDQDALSAIDLMSKALGKLNTIVDFDQTVEQIQTNLSNCFYQLEDLAINIQDYIESLDNDTSEINTIVTRLNSLDHLKRKYKMTLEEIIAYQQKIQTDLIELNNIEYLESEIQERINQSTRELTLISNKLSEVRQITAKQLKTMLELEFNELNMPHTLFQVQLEKMSEGVFTNNGTDKIEFLISTNKGESLKPLSKIASGGEISRIMLAFKSILAHSDSINTLIFDEIDTGISGKTATIVGKKMQKLSKKHQIICITHLPQIAAAADQNFLIEKNETSTKTTSSIKKLSEQEKIDAISNLLSGGIISNKATEAAKELIESFKK